MTNIKFVLRLIIALPLLITFVNAADRYQEPRMQYGLFADLNLNYHSAAFSNLPGVPNCCPRFEQGFGAAYSVGLLVDIPIDETNTLIMRPGLYNNSALLLYNEQTVAGINGTDRIAEIEHSIDASLNAIGIDLFYNYNLESNFFTFGGLGFGYVFQHDYYQQEQLIKPENEGTFENGSRIRNISQGSIPIANLMFANLNFGLSYEFPLNIKRTLRLVPELIISYNLIPVAQSYDWNSFSVKLGFSFKISRAHDIDIKIKPQIHNLQISEYDVCGSEIKYISKPNTLYFNVSGTAAAGLDYWEYEISGKDTTIYKSTVNRNAIPAVVPWGIPDYMAENIYHHDDTMYVVFYIKDKVKQRVSDSSIILVHNTRDSLRSDFVYLHPDTHEKLDTIFIEDIKEYGEFTKSNIIPEYILLKPNVKYLDTLRGWNVKAAAAKRRLIDTSGNGAPDEIYLNLRNIPSRLPLRYNGELETRLYVVDLYKSMCMSASKLIPLKRIIYGFDAAVQALGVYNLDTLTVRKPNPQIVLEERRSKRLQPLLPYIFFADGNSDIPERYFLLEDTDIGSFSLNELHDMDIISTYHHVLNILGYRLREYSEAEITLTGCNSEINLDAETKDISLARVKSVKKYLTDIWGIDPKRIHTVSRGIPLSFSKTDHPNELDNNDAEEENRRVEISADDSRLLNPIITNGMRLFISPDIIEFTPQLSLEAGLKDWSVDYKMNSLGVGSLGWEEDIPDTLYWRLKQLKQQLFAAKADSLVSQFVISDKKNQKAVVRESFPVEYRTVEERRNLGTDSTYNEYSLILFDFASDKISEWNRTILKYVLKDISPNSEVSVFGSTDRVGPPTTNKELSLNRAEQAAQVLSLSNEFLRIAGLGEINRYDNNLPEGRFYCRTVFIRVKTPDDN